MNNFATYGGLAVIVDDSLSSVRVLDWKKWMDGRAYPVRVQKKWDKRFGRVKTVADGQSYQFKHNVVMNSITYEMLKRRVA